jgi:hypothetical protein
MKKLGLGVIVIVIIAALYYFVSGSEQLTEEMKARVNTELTVIEENGFAVQQREIKEQEEHFVLSFDDPKKIVTFFKAQGSEITLEDVEILKGTNIGVDIRYLNDSYSSLSVDMYPLNLPPALTEASDLDDADKAFIAQLNDMLGKKALLVHVDFNKLLSSFKGYLKDIDETLSAENALTIKVKGALFNGTIKNDRINTLEQEIKELKFLSGDNLELELKHLKSDYALKGKSLYNSTYTYAIDDIKLHAQAEKETYSVAVKNIKGTNVTAVENGLASNKMTLFVSSMETKDNIEKNTLLDTTFSFNVGNLDMDTLKKLEDLDMNNEEEANKMLQTLISKGITMEIPNFEVKKIEYQGQKIDGFSLSSTFEVKKSANLAAIQANPLNALSAVNTKTKIVLSDALFVLLAQQPKAMLLTMMIQPKVVNGKKVYEVELKDGHLIVNGKQMM